MIKRYLNKKIEYYENQTLHFKESEWGSKKHKEAYDEKRKWIVRLERWEDFVRDFKMGLMIILVPTVIFSILIGLNKVIDYNTCNEYHNVTKLETRYEFWNGCFVSYNTQWVRLDQFKLTSTYIEEP